MVKITLDSETIKVMALFESITRANLKDCFMNKERMVFVVQEGEIGKALGKKKANLYKIERLLNRKIKIVEFTPNVLQFIVNMLFPLKVADMREDDGIITITGIDTQTKGLIIGARAQNLRNYESIVQKYFPDIKELKVI
ncbi:MAG: NusA-like transcription termination signal-binding factor [archaeon]